VGCQRRLALPGPAAGKSAHGNRERSAMTTRGEESGPVCRPRAASTQSATVDEDKGLRYLKRALRKAERRAGDGSDIGGTGATILKFLPAPLARLLDKGRIGTEEVRAADDIAVAFHAQAGALFVSHPRM